MTIEREILDPKLAVALDEIDAVLAKHAIAGAVCVASSTHAAFRLTFPAWSAVQIDEKGLSIKSSVKRDGREHLAASTHLLLSLRDLTVLQGTNLVHIGEVALETMKEHGVEVDHGVLGGDDEGGVRQ